MLLEIRSRAQRDLHSITFQIGQRSGDIVIAQCFAQRLLDRCQDLLEASGNGRPLRETPKRAEAERKRL